MTPGKVAAQAGHAFTQQILRAVSAAPWLLNSYETIGEIGTKVCLGAKNLHQLQRAYHELIAKGIPCSLITDSGHIHGPDFNGKPIITALGVGPVLRRDSYDILKRFNVYGD